AESGEGRCRGCGCCLGALTALPEKKKRAICILGLELIISDSLAGIPSKSLLVGIDDRLSINQNPVLVGNYPLGEANQFCCRRYPKPPRKRYRLISRFWLVTPTTSQFRQAETLAILR